jgi:Peptidase C13 family
MTVRKASIVVAVNGVFAWETSMRNNKLAGWLMLAGFLVLAACETISALAASAVPQADAGQGAPLTMRAVLVAGDGGLRVFDNGVAGIAAWLRDTGGVEPDQVTRLSASAAVIARQQAEPASWHHVMQAIEALKPAPGQACLVFITSHGIKREGVALSYDDSVLSPAALDRALAAGCGDAPTVAIVSACYSGSFAQLPMARANRIVLTAARADRPSFGCGAGEAYTFFDQCLLRGLDHGSRWREVFAATRSCVEQRESREDEVPSMPQGWFGTAVADLVLPRAAR